MKKILLVSFFFAAFGLSKVDAQIYNPGFETWTNDTAYFDGLTVFPKDTFPYSDPLNWTTTNALSGADTFGNVFLVKETANAHTGSKAVELTTDTLNKVFITLLNSYRQLTIPGLAVNGRFKLNFSSNILSGGTISPAQLTGAGQPFTQRLDSIKGFYNYTPVYNDSLGHIDSCIVWAILRKGTKLIASAQFVSGTNTGTYAPFAAHFQYVDCDAPDTLVIMLAASIPNFGSVITGQTKLVRGSVLQVDDLSYDTLPASFNFPPIARLDTATTTKNTAKNVLVKANDDDCNDPVAGLTLAVVIAPNYGTAVAAGTTHITYTPNNNYVGMDSFTYSISDGVGTSRAVVRMAVLNSSGISEANEIPVLIYPVPASNQLNIQFENKGKATLRVFDMIGNLVLTSVLTQNSNSINVENLASGVYGIQITNDSNAVIARSKFTISK
jgi:hypothetical protein